MIVSNTIVRIDTKLMTDLYELIGNSSKMQIKLQAQQYDADNTEYFISFIGLDENNKINKYADHVFFTNPLLVEGLGTK